MSRLRTNAESGYIGYLAMVLAAAVVLVVAAFLWGQKERRTTTGPEPQPQTIPGQAVQKGHDVECMSNLRSIRQAIEMSKITDERLPSNLQELSSAGITADMTRCPVSGQPYRYDPASGNVWCTTPGHQNY
jgi:hypothetical protein